MKKMNIYILSFEPDGVPNTVDGDWAGPMSAFESKKDAEEERRRIMSGVDDEYSWLGRFDTGADGKPESTSSRGLRLEIEEVILHKKDGQ